MFNNSITNCEYIEYSLHAYIHIVKFFVIFYFSPFLFITMHNAQCKVSWHSHLFYRLFSWQKKSCTIIVLQIGFVSSSPQHNLHCKYLRIYVCKRVNLVVYLHSLCHLYLSLTFASSTLLLSSTGFGSSERVGLVYRRVLL